MIKNITIDVDDVVVINDVKIKRVNKIYYNINDDTTKVKKSAVLEVLNNREVWINGNIDWVLVNKYLSQAGKETIELYDEQIVIDHANRTIYIDGEGIVDTYEYDENGESIWECDDSLLKEITDIVDECMLKEGLDQHYNGEPYFRNYSVNMYDNKISTTDMFRYVLDAYNVCIDYVYPATDKYSVNTELSKRIKTMEDWFIDKNLSGAFKTVFLSDSVESYWNTNKEKIYQSIYDTIKGYNTRQELLDAMDRWIEENKFRYTNEIKRIMDAETEYKYKQAQEQKEFEGFYKEYYEKSQKAKYNFKSDIDNDVKAIKDKVEGMTYKEACRLLHPDLNNGTTTEEFQILQTWKDVWFDSKGKWK